VRGFPPRSPPKRGTVATAELAGATVGVSGADDGDATGARIEFPGWVSAIASICRIEKG